ncbi:MAG: hypothetical protein HC808_03860 [Candidatus Competibacteraceae bacterium]|nr:hypothetical protein [Candidatus Competibacteraceae bacterium]
MHHSMTRKLTVFILSFVVLTATSWIFPDDSEARKVRNTTRHSVHKSSHRSVKSHRDTNVRRDVNVRRDTNVRRNTNVNVRRDVNVDVDVDYRRRYPVGAAIGAAAVTAAVVGSVVYSLPPSVSS